MSISFTKEKLVALDVGGRCASAAVVDRGYGGTLNVRQVGWTEYRAGSTKKEIAAALRAMWRKHDFGSYTVAICIHSRSLVYRFCKLPTLTSSELEQALLVEAEESLQIPPDEIAVDWHPFPRRAGAREERVEGVLVAAPRKDIEEQIAIVQEAGLYPIIADVGCMAVCNLYLAMQEDQNRDKVVCLTNLLPDGADTCIMRGEQFAYPRPIYYRRNGGAQAREYLIVNMQDVLKYYQFKLRQDPIESVIFTGELGDDDAFLRQVEDAIQLPVSYWNPLDEVLDPVLLNRESIDGGGLVSSLVTTLGMALREP